MYIIPYFYSTNCESFKFEDGYHQQPNGWLLCTWPRYLVWNRHQAEFIKREVGSDQSTVCGEIWFSDTDAPAPDNMTKAVVVFDVQPVRNSFYQNLVLGFEYYVPKTAIAFAKDISRTCSTLGLNVYYKRKRDVGALASRKYLSTIRKLANESHFFEVATSIAARRMIENADVVVSVPFTSTAHIAKNMGKPSCFYDPLAQLQADDRGAHGIPIIQSAEALAIWLEMSMPR